MKNEKKPVEEIKTDSARNTVINQHKKFGKTISVNGCFGSSNIEKKKNWTESRAKGALK